MINFKTRRGMRGLALSSFTGAAMAAGMLVAPGIAHADTQASHFIWTATSSNTSGNATLINNLATDGAPGALLFVTPNFDPGGVNGGYDNSPIGVYYDSSAGTSGEWGVFNENSTTMPAGTSFNVFLVPPRPGRTAAVTAFSSTAPPPTTLPTPSCRQPRYTTAPTTTTSLECITTRRSGACSTRAMPRWWSEPSTTCW